MSREPTTGSGGTNCGSRELTADSGGLAVSSILKTKNGLFVMNKPFAY